MKTTILKISTIVLLFLFIGAGCQKDDLSHYYRGKVVDINNGNGCYNLIEIINIPKEASLLVGATITFDPKLYTKKNLEIGDMVYFKIILFKEWIGPNDAYCRWPQYVGQQIEFYEN
jgi:hypothetical protein